MGSRFNFFFTEAIRSLSTNVATSVAATLSMLVALLLVTVFLFLLFFARSYAENVQDDAGRVKVFIVDGTPEERVNALRAEMEGMSEVATVTFVNKDEAMERAREQFRDNPEILRDLPGNPFPASLEADLHEPRLVEEVAGRFEGQEGVQEVTFGGDEVKKVIETIDMLRWVFLVLAVFLVAAATMLVSNTIRLSVFARRREIEVMKLVGASNSFVRLPFMIEGFLCGVAGAIGAVALAKLIGYVLNRALEGKLGGFATAEVNTLLIFGIVLGMGILLGGVGSGLTIRKYLRV